MITSIHIKGFKSFKDTSITFAPFVAIAGLNGVGKSNLFDAIQLLAKLSETDIRAAFQGQRGEAYELFSKYEDGTFADEMIFKVEMLVQNKIKDKWGEEAEVKYIRLVYELALKRKTDAKGIEKIYIEKEELKQIAKDSDTWLKTFFGTKLPTWFPKTIGGRVPFISTEEGTNEKLTIRLHQDKGSRGRPRPSEDLEQTVLSSVFTVEFPHVLAVKEEMKQWHFLQLNPVELRKSSPRLSARDFMQPDGSNLASALFRMKSENAFVMNDISRTMAGLVSDVKFIDVVDDVREKRYVLRATMADGPIFTAEVLSEGTLRMLALCTLLYDKKYQGLLCFEEPENGIHPTRIPQILKVLQRLKTTFDEHTDSDEMPPLRQVVLNTHSPLVIGHISATENIDTLTYFAQMLTNIEDHKKIKITKFTPVIQSKQFTLFDDYNQQQQKISQNMLATYLNHDEYN
jgi:predicted ATPase